jgi:anti-sigma factor RsiW
MKAACESVRGRLPAYARESLSAAERRAVREHLAECAVCRADAARSDPTILFAGLPVEEVSREEVASVVAAVRASVALRQAEQRLGATAGRRRDQGRRARGVRAAAAAAVVLLSLAVPSGLRSPADEDRKPALQRVHGAASSVAATGAAAEAPGGATIYDWNPGAGEPRVVWIVDGSLDI